MKKLLLILILLLGCSSDNIEYNPKVNSSSEKQLLTFSFLIKNNNIPVDSSGDIRNNSVNIFLPVSTELSSLIPNFTISEKFKFCCDISPK